MMVSRRSSTSLGDLSLAIFFTGFAMSTPKKSKRHTTTARDEAMFAHRSGDWRSGIHNPDIAVRFTLL
jgi:hypothetical protein